MPSIRKCTKNGGHRCRFQDNLENANSASFLTRRYNGVLWKTQFLGTSLLHKNLYSEKTGHNVFQKLTQDGSMIEVYNK